MGHRRSIRGLRVLITGASQGIGKALAIEGGKRGAKLILVARNEQLLQEVAEESRRGGTEVETVVADITSPDDRARMLQAALDRFGGLDILINNAGIGATGHFADAGEDRLRRIFEVNFFALAETCRSAIPILRNGVTPMIVNIGSIAGKRGIPARSEYSASKFAVQGFTEALRAEMARFDIDVLLANPGLTATDFPKNMLENKAVFAMDHMRAMTADTVAQLTYRAVEKGKNDVVFTFKGKLLCWLSRFFPRLVDRIVAKKVRNVFKDEIARRNAPHITAKPGTARAENPSPTA